MTRKELSSSPPSRRSTCSSRCSSIVGVCELVYIFSLEVAAVFACPPSFNDNDDGRWRHNFASNIHYYTVEAFWTGGCYRCCCRRKKRRELSFEGSMPVEIVSLGLSPKTRLKMMLRRNLHEETYNLQKLELMISD